MPTNGHSTPPNIPSTPGGVLPSSWYQTSDSLSSASKAFVKSRKSRFSEEVKPLDETIPLVAKKGFTFGCDPEGFIFNTVTNEPVPACGIIPGSKCEPFKVDKGALQVDGMAAEFNIDPVSTYEEWEENITIVIAALQTYLPKDHEIRWVPSVVFPEAVFNAAPEDCKELGCSPDFDAWSGGVNPPPSFENCFMRCAGGHLHFGWSKNEDVCGAQHVMNCQDLVKQLDWFLGGWSVAYDQDTLRRNLYGKMGACRYKDYGVEYRVLSNFWVATKELRLMIWNRMVTAVDQMNAIYIPDRTPRGFENILRNSINQGKYDPDLCHTLRYPITTLDANFCRV